MIRSGKTSRKIAIARSASWACSGLRFPSGVPGRGLRKFSGISSGSSARSSKASSSAAPSSRPCRGCRRCRAPSHLAHELAGLVALLPGVRGDDLREEAAARLEVVVVVVDAGVAQRLGLLAREQPERAVDLQRGLGPDPLDRAQHLVHQAPVRPAHRDDDAEVGGARGLGGPGRAHHVVERQERVALGRRVEVHRLRAEGAVLLAAAGLGADERLQLDPLAPPAPAHLVRQAQQGRQLGGRQVDQRARLLHRDGALLVQDRGLELAQDRHGRTPGRDLVTARRYQA